MFQELKRKSIFEIRDNYYDSINYMLYFVNKRAALKAVNSKGKEIESGNYSGGDRITRELDELFKSIINESAFIIDWGNDENIIYIDNYPRIMKLLKINGNILNEKMEKISFAEEKKRVTIKLAEQEERLKPKAYVEVGEREIVFLSGEYVISDNKIYHIEDIGENYFNMYLFLKEFNRSDLNNYLSLLYSSYENINIEYREYNIEYGETEEAQAKIIIDKIDSTGALYAQIGYKIASANINWISEYNISTIAHTNDIEEKIILKEMNTGKADSNIQKFVELIEVSEKKTRAKGSTYFQGNLVILSEEVAKDIITNNLSFLLNNFEMIGNEKLIKYKLKIVRPKLNINMSYNIDFFEGEANVELDGEEKSIFDLIHNYREKGYIILKDGTSGIINRSYIEKLERIFKKKKEGAKISFFDLPLVGELLEEKILKEKFPKAREIYEGFNNIESYMELEKVVNAELRKYQEYGIKWMRYLYDKGLGGCLADDMGLGKTIQAIGFFSTTYPKESVPSMVVMPKSLIYNWEKELKKFNPSLSYYIFYGNNRDIEEAVKNNIILTTYGTLRSEIENIREKKFLTVMLDESQNIKNASSLAYKAVMLLQCKQRFALSGTPVENNIGELYSLFSFLNPSMFGTHTEFNRNYGVPVQKENNEEAIMQLKKKIYPFILRRTKKEVLKDLPDRIENTIYIEMEKEHEKYYNERRNYYKNILDKQIEEEGILKSQFFIFQALGELRQAASNPEIKTEGSIVSQKREVLMENIVDAVSNKHKVLVFTNYLGTIENIGSDLEQNGIEYMTITGATKDRQKIVDEFQNGKKYKVLIMTLKTGGVGLNLTEADTVFIYDPWWNKAAELQAIDRTHRIGQKNTVFSYRMITKNTIEEKIAELQEKKGELFNNLIASDSASAKKLEKSDIDFILGD